MVRMGGLVLLDAELEFLWKGIPLPKFNISLHPHHLLFILSTLNRIGTLKIRLYKFLTIFYLFRIVFIFICLRFNEFHFVLCTNLCTKYCCKSLVKQSPGVQEWINQIYIEVYRENGCGLRKFRSTNDLQEQIKFKNRGSVVVW